jgi:ABC-type nitrate/sulfonate/bicarbonate transport system permease component
MKNISVIFTPFHKNDSVQNSIMIGWIAMIAFLWFLSSRGETHTIPTPAMIVDGFGKLYQQGLIRNMFLSFGLFTKTIFFSLLITLPLSYISVIPIFKPIAVIASKLRYLPLVGIVFILAQHIGVGRELQVTLLSIFVSVFLITSLIAEIANISTEEFDHCRSLKYSRWKTLYELVIIGRLHAILDVIRMNFAIIWMMMVYIETQNVGNGGIGVMIYDSNRTLAMGKVFAAQMTILLVGILLDFGLQVLREKLFPYVKTVN